jgi:hypothetical protein
MPTDVSTVSTVVDYIFVFRFFASVIGFACGLLVSQLFAKGFDTN